MAYSGKFFPKNPQKYRGNVNNIIWRSRWELTMLKRFDEDPSFLEYGSEEIVIPYISPVDGKPHRYFVDFYVKMISKQGVIKKYIVEVKPLSQTMPPKPKSRLTPAYLKECQTYAVNQAKWTAAKKFAEYSKIEFIVMTEKEIYG